jgi:hypothetical protein
VDNKEEFSGQYSVYVVLSKLIKPTVMKKKIDLKKTNNKDVKKADPMADVKEYMDGKGKLALYMKEIQTPDPNRLAFYT